MSEIHEIRVQGRLDDRWVDWLGGLALTRENDGTTTLTGPLADQAALHGVLNTIRDLNLPIVSVRRVPGCREANPMNAIVQNQYGPEVVLDLGDIDKPVPAQRTMMQAIVQDKYGSSSFLALRRIDKPEIGVDDVLVRVRAAGVHIGDLHVMTGQPYLMRIVGFGLRAPKARVRGMDFAGTVEAIGSDVTQFRPGDDVFGTCDGAFAEYASARADTLAPKPSNLTFEQAAAVPHGALAALQGLRDTGGIKPEQKVLIIGASGDVGMFAVQIAKWFGAEVTGVCSTTKMDMVRSIGADRVIDYGKEDFTRRGKQYDLILDTGGNRSLSEVRRALTPTGTLVIVGGEGGDRWIGRGTWRSVRALVLSRFVSQRLRPVLATPNTSDLVVLKQLIETARITPMIGRTYTLSETSDAIRQLEEGHARGKVVITV